MSELRSEARTVDLGFGKLSTGKNCLRFRRLGDMKFVVIREMLAESGSR